MNSLLMRRASGLVGDCGLVDGSLSSLDKNGLPLVRIGGEPFEDGVERDLGRGTVVCKEAGFGGIMGLRAVVCVFLSSMGAVVVEEDGLFDMDIDLSRFGATNCCLVLALNAAVTWDASNILLSRDTDILFCS